MVNKKKLTPRRYKGTAKSPARDEPVEEETIDEEPPEAEPVKGDDCEVVDDEDDGDFDCNNFVAEEDELVSVEAVASLVFNEHFGDIALDDSEADDDSADDIWDDEKIPDPIYEDDSDEEEELRRQIRQNEESAEEILVLGKCFSSAAEFKNALLRYTLKSKYNIKMYLSTQKKLGARCASTDPKYPCDWRCYCAYEKRKHKLQIKVFYDKHCCIRSGYSKLLKPTSIAELYEERLRLDPKLQPKEIADEIARNYSLTVDVEQCRKAKTRLSRARRLSHEEHFSRIWDYEAELHQSNRGTITDIVTIPGTRPGMKQRFDQFYVCFEAQRHAWKTYCRPIIGLDGAFLKWDIKGQLLAAVGRDADNRIVPIAWAVVEVENEINWDWFISHLKMDLGLGDGRDITIISDKQKGLVNAILNVLPQVEHRLCARHNLGNWKRDSHDMELERIYWKIARSYTEGDYRDNLAALASMNPTAYQSLLKTRPETWSRAFFRVGSCCNDNLNNLNESFNKTIKEARRLPLLELLEEVRRQCMVRTEKRNRISLRWKSRFTKSAHREIELAIKKAVDCKMFMSTGDNHEIHYKTFSYCVKMGAKVCGCGKWQLNGIPCEHAAKVITKKKEKEVEDYVSEFFTTKNWQLTYERSIQPVQGMNLWPRLNRLHVLPPPFRNKVGRRSNYERKKSRNEKAGTKNKLSRVKRVMTCSNCQEEGHNKTTCQKDSVEPPAKRPRGRPKKDQATSSQGTQEGSQMGTQFSSLFFSQP